VNNRKLAGMGWMGKVPVYLAKTNSGE